MVKKLFKKFLEDRCNHFTRSKFQSYIQGYIRLFVLERNLMHSSLDSSLMEPTKSLKDSWGADWSLFERQTATGASLSLCFQHSASLRFQAKVAHWPNNQDGASHGSRDSVGARVSAASKLEKAPCFMELPLQRTEGRSATRKERNKRGASGQRSACRKFTKKATQCQRRQQLMGSHVSPPSAVPFAGARENFLKGNQIFSIITLGI